MKPAVAHITESFTESVIREMTRLTLQYGGVNLSQGFPDFPAPAAVKEAAVAAIRADINQYAITWGAQRLREAIAAKAARYNHLQVEPAKNVTVTCGSTEAMIATLLALINPGDEVIIFEPFYENYGPDTLLAAARPRFVKLHPPDWHFDENELRQAFNRHTRAIIINTPNNPTGKVFSRQELECIASLCQTWEAFAITDEIYEHILFDGATHLSIASLEGMAGRTITINAISKTYSLTGWRVGWAIAPERQTTAIRKVHDFLTVGAAAPLQEAAAVALQLADDYYRNLAALYQQKRDRLLGILQAAGFDCWIPRGAYYIMADAGRLMQKTGHRNDNEFARWLIREIGVAAVPGSSFYQNPADGRSLLRFCFCKREETLAAAEERLRRLPA
ncbi:MAG: aminotransferase class I/II-fold pyridoxal phosphate-dependent enzyme [candidate division KSB1 bacterium]|nr:aminotransferase class I/II-fold pyridoxal phosphate-dependent enzyme [candidate division KSB1 bacterium]MDZ7274870.1 aminotransferase class I/II-fold pyridoxal phosphate-dependent enzyme [candidate division KSB1 bacterium]MDZ7286678.1 aminotransferase class I/II-fold pyridoxal phosphate-dependent enzyme [candidate division KSB1 bacterium]MDZ7299159.1 aminotransferase class I/II-fold pyridoxal phosphate-dependent enzyme [candidate division KSB1 bacterium]MDZ7307031.1 aminotransferase class I